MAHQAILEDDGYRVAHATLALAPPLLRGEGATAVGAQDRAHLGQLAIVTPVDLGTNVGRADTALAW